MDKCSKFLQLYSLDQLLGNHTSSTKHSETSILQLLGLHDGKLLRVLGLQPERVETDIAGVVIILKLLERELALGLAESLERTVPLKRSNEEGEANQEERRLGIDLVKVTNGGSDVLVVSLKLGREATKVISTLNL